MLTCMRPYAVLVLGVAGSGQSTLAKRLAPALSLPLISKEAIKEALAGQSRPRGRRVVPAAWRSQLRGPVGASSRRSAGSARNELAHRARSRAAQGSGTASIRDPLHLLRPDSPRSTSQSPRHRPAFDTPRRDQPGDDRLIQRGACGRDLSPSGPSLRSTRRRTQIWSRSPTGSTTTGWRRRENKRR